MYKNYIIVAFRNLLRNKTFSFINIFGLALSMSISLLVLMRLKDQLSYDDFHKKSDRIYRITTKVTNEAGQDYLFATTPLPLSNKISQEYNITEDFARIYPLRGREYSDGRKNLKLNAAFTDPGFLKIFSFNLSAGNKHTALSAPNSIIISEQTAKNFFGQEQPVGRTLVIKDLGEVVVKGVLAAAPHRSHIEFDGFISMSTVASFENLGTLPKISADWNRGTDAYTYLLLKETVSEGQLTAAATRISDGLMKDMKLKGRESMVYRIQPFDKIILGEEMMYSMGNTGTKGKVGAEIAIALVILISACFNYTNLSIARSVSRGKEVGVRKVAGAFRFQIFQQFIIESIILTMLALCGAYVILRILIDYSPLGQEMGAPTSATDFTLFVWFFLFSLVTGIFAGLVPSYSLSAFKPVEVLKNLSNIRLFGGAGLRKTLIVIQFSLSIIILMFTQVFMQQFDYLAASDPGFRRDNILNVQLNGEDYNVLSQQISSVKGVEAISAASVNPGKYTGGRSQVRLAAGTDPFLIDHYDVDPSFIDVLDLRLVAGDGFRTLNTKKDEEEKYVVINEKSLPLFKFKNAGEALGQQLLVDDSLRLTITGVIKNFYANGFDQNMNPIILRNRQKELKVMNIRTSREPDSALIGEIAAVWKANAKADFSANTFRNELFDAKNPSGTVSTLTFLAIISITIASLGLLGMVIYHTETRKKEIGIRKVMGADVSGIVILVARSFIKLIVVAGLVAIPIGYVAGFFFLNIFANRITIGIDIIAFSFLCVLFLSALITGTQIFRSATANPVKSLRTE